MTHVQLGQTSALLDGHDPLGQSVGLGDALVDARLRHEGDGSGTRLVRRPHGTHDDGLRGGNGRVGVAHLSPRDLTALDDNLGLGPEKRGFPEAQVRELADFHAADDVRHPVRHRGVDGVLCDVSLDAEVIRSAVLFEDASLRLHLGGGLPRAGDHLADSSHGLRVRRHDTDGAHVMEDILRGDGLGADPRLGEGDVFGDGLVEVVTHHEHVEMLVDGVLGVRSRRVRGRREDLLLAADLDDVRGVSAAGALAVVGVNGPPFESLDGFFNAARLVQGVGVDGHGDVVRLGDGEAVVDRGGCGAPVLVEFHADRTGVDDVLQTLRFGGVSLAGECKVER